jgi:protein-L-isoaspartate(D-aspartate) O-methyltransferase
MRFLLEMRQAGVTDAPVLGAMELSPRTHFAPEHMRGLALHDRPLPLACGQAMTPPSVVGRMVMALNPAPASRVLEVGAGSGYQTAVLSLVAAKVTSVERHRTLVSTARQNLGVQRRDNAHVYLGDGLDGWAGEAPYDRIIINAAVEAVPDALRAQLSPGGVIVAPVVTERGVRLQHHRTAADGSPVVTDLGPIEFAPASRGVADDDRDCSPG